MLDSSEFGNGNIELNWLNLRDCMKEAATWERRNYGRIIKPQVRIKL